MTRRTVLLLIGLLCWSGQALAQTVDTSATDNLPEQTSPVTQQVTKATQQLEPVTSQVLGSGGSSGGGSSGGGSSGGSGSSGGGDAAEPCKTKAAGGSQGGGAGGGTGGGAGGSSDSGGQSAGMADGPDGALIAVRERADQMGGGVLGDFTVGGDSLVPLVPQVPESPVPESPSEFPFWGGLALLVVLGLGFAGFLAALTSHFLGEARTD
jgi:hypothetical protein